MNQLQTMDEMKNANRLGKNTMCILKRDLLQPLTTLLKKCKALNITNAEYRLLTIIFGYGGKDGNAFPSQETLAKRHGSIITECTKKYLSSLFLKKRVFGYYQCDR
ncbi:hypothetical protein GCM10020331_010460 [Ectobacillus funiculus]